MSHKADRARAEKGWVFRNGKLVRKEGTPRTIRITAATKRATDKKLKELGLLSPEAGLVVPARLVRAKEAKDGRKGV